MFFEGKSTLKKCLNFDGLSRQETIEQRFPIELFQVWSLIGSMFTPVWAKYLHLSSYLSAEINSPEDFLKLAIT